MSHPLDRSPVNRLTAVCLALAVSAAVVPPAAAAEVAPERLDARAQELFEALRDGRTVRAVRAFAPALRAELHPPRLTAAWRQLTATYGAARELTPDPAASAGSVRVYDLALERGRVRLTLRHDDAGEVTALELAPPAAAATPAPRAASAVSLSTGAPPLLVPATLVVPRAEGPVPAALLLGDLDADGDGARRGGAARPLRDLAEALAARGIASLRLTRRGDAWRGEPPPTVEGDVLADARAALAQLRARPEIDPARLFVVGHGLGAVLAPEVADRAGPVAALVLVGAPGRALPAALYEATRPAGGARLSGDALAYQRLAERAVAGRLEDGEKFEGHGDAFWRDVAARDPLGYLRRLRRPALVVRGERDALATDEDHASWRAALAKVETVRFEVLPGVDHDLARPGAAASDPAALRRIADFLAAAPPPSDALASPAAAARRPGR
jgi:predicted alpha/beta-hydrolase family hydrolase